ncbi:unnamed protein product [Coffea canephora]|uniref:AB hydrolase-1 domain-containing protein n=1 Tax=Coffea canephora TaxID=49390 RepID=A0A068TQT6_COFCA|nr:unnamed protein product [Coffea canephora]
MKHVGFLRLEVRSPTHFPAGSPRPDAPVIVHSAAKLNMRAVSSIAGAGGKVSDKPSICTADELHYVPVPDSHWRLALWRYRPSSPVGIKRNHPLLLLSGLGTNAIGYDLAPGSSFARFMSVQGFDTWILEVRGAGLSENDEAVNRSDDFLLREKLKDAFVHIAEGFSNLLNEALARARQDSAANQVRNWSQKLGNIFAGGQKSVGLQEQFSLLMDDFQKQLDLILKYNWDFDHYLEEDVPAAMEYVRTQCKPKDDRLLAIGHSMGGILLYAMLSQNGYKGRHSELASIVTLGSSLDYSTSRSSLRLLLPLVDPAQALSVPVVPLGAFMAAAFPLASRPPYFLSWLNPQVSAQNMMRPEMLEKLVLNNFCTIPAKLLVQLRTVFQEGGLRNRNETFIYKHHLNKSKVPILALAGDQDLICPPEAVYETVKLVPGRFVKFKVLGEPRGPHYAHYDLVGGRLAPKEVYPCIVEFLQHHDLT